MIFVLLVLVFGPCISSNVNSFHVSTEMYILGGGEKEGRPGLWTGGRGGAHQRLPQEAEQPHPGRQEQEQEGWQEKISISHIISFTHHIMRSFVPFPIRVYEDYPKCISKK